MTTRVAITGVAIVGPLGTGPAFWDALVAGASGATRLTIEGIGAVTAFPVPGVTEAARERFGQRETRRMDRVGQLSALAVAAGLEDAGAHGCAAERIGAVLGCVHGGAQTIEDAYRTAAARGYDRISPLTIPLGLTNAGIAAAARMCAIHGPAQVTSTACAAGTDAIGLGTELIRSGRADLVVAGGAEAPLTSLIVGGYRRLGALSGSDADPRTVSRPFDRARDGFVIAEGAGVLVLEDLEHARRRGARIYAELAGWANTCDAAHLTDADPTGAGAARAVRLALADAGIAPDAVGYVNAHATSTPSGDRAEAHALRAAGLAGVAVSSTKGAHGHPLGAAGGIEAAITALALWHQQLPATLNLDDPDPEIDLPHIRSPRTCAIDVAISNSFGFGGHNACVVMRTVPAGKP